MYYGNYDQEGKYIGFYIRELHGDDIPNPYIELTPEQHQEALTGNYRVVDGKHTYVEPPGPTTDELKTVKLAELDRTAATAYVAGFYSDATGVNLYYDSDEETQRLLEGLGRRATLPDWETRMRYPGIALAGYAPVRARPAASDPASAKTIQLLDAGQIVQLVADMDEHLYAVKVTLWTKQGEVTAATTPEEVQAITWTEA